ncbi:MAG: class I SAM-dependent methyltransferase [bacterium]
MIESGWFYGTFIDPVLQKMRKRIAIEIQPGEKVVDIACGTGAQVFEFSERASNAVGVDLSDSMIKRAKKNKIKRNFSNIEFYVADATNLSIFPDKRFDVATMSFALHQFEPGLHVKILDEMKRIASKFIIVDYAVPLPRNYIGYGSKIAEFFAGREHHANFQKFYKLGGLNKILINNQLSIEKMDFFGRDAFQLVICM